MIQEIKKVLDDKGIQAPELRESAAKSLRFSKAFKVTIPRKFASLQKTRGLLERIKHIIQVCVLNASHGLIDISQSPAFTTQIRERQRD
jgi:hypothetical protein